LVLLPIAVTASPSLASSQTSEKKAGNPKGAKERRAARLARLVASFKGDRKAIYDQHGLPSSRSRQEESDGRIAEHWRYTTKGLHFVFVGDTLIRTEKD